VPEIAARLRILVADDHATVRQGLKLLIDSQSDMTVIGEAADGKDVLEQANALKPDIVIMDISMPGMNGLVATRLLKRAQPDAAIVALTRHEDDLYLKELLRAGASGYVLKQSAPAEFLRAIRAVAAGGVYLDPAMSSGVADGLLDRDRATARRPPTPISERESDVLRLIAIGYSNKEVARILNLSVRTIETHRKSIKRKLGADRAVDLGKYAVQMGLTKE